MTSIAMIGAVIFFALGFLLLAVTQINWIETNDGYIAIGFSTGCLILSLYSITVYEGKKVGENSSVQHE